MQSAVKNYFGQVNVMVKRDLIHVLRNSESLVMTIFLPIMVTLVFVYVFGGALDEGGDRKAYLNYVLPGILIMAPAFGAYMTGIGVNNDMSKGIVDRFRSMDIRQSSVLTGHIVASLVRNLLGAVIVIVFACLIGFRTEANLIQLLGVSGMSVIYILMITMISLMVGLIGSSPESVGGIMMFVQFAPYVSSAFVPTETMPKALMYFANNQPFTPITNTIRGLLLGGEIGSDGIVALTWCIGIILLCYFVSKYVYEHKTSS